MPIRTIGGLIAGWVILALMVVGLKMAGFRGDVPTAFPISVFNGPAFHFYGILPLLLFLAVVIYSLKAAPGLTAFQVWVIGFLLIILGNLGQGGWWQAFVEPFYKSGFEYYSDAIKISSWPGWLESFNENQRTFLKHTQTHPPFAVLIHYLILRVFANSLPMLGFVFAFISSLSIVIVRQIFQILCVPVGNRNRLALLFAVIPAINIYSAVSLDGLILTSATLCLLGMVMVFTSGRSGVPGVILMGLGLTITNLLTFVGLFLFAAATLLALMEYIVGKKRAVAASLLITGVSFMAAAAILHAAYGYNYFQNFLAASAVENPTGFKGVQEPLTYFLTRVECVCEIALFLSFGFTAILFYPEKLNASYTKWRAPKISLMLSGVIALMAMFLTGAYRTGETARAAIFIYPYLMFSLKDADPTVLSDIIVLAAMQTAAMQLLGGYYW